MIINSIFVDHYRISMNNTDIVKELETIQREGYCEKQSRFLKSWRKRWIVLTNNIILTYKERRVYQSPTQVILLKDIISIKTCDEEIEMKNAFKVENKETNFYFCCESALEKEQWIGAIGKAMVKRDNRDFDD